MVNDRQGENSKAQVPKQGPTAKIDTAILLAAGFSSRMGAFKPLLQIGDKSAIEHVIDTLKESNVKNIICVTGYQRDQIQPILVKNQVEEAYNDDYGTGMFSSIQTGVSRIASLGNAVKGFYLVLVDCPLIPPEVFHLMEANMKEYGESFLVPCYRGKKGHPLYIPAGFVDEILNYHGDGGLKAITNRHDDQMVRLEVGIEGVVLDMDTPEGYEEVLSYYHNVVKKDHRGKSTFSKISVEDELMDLERALQGRRIFLIRHGEIQQHQEKIFLGQTDVPLSERGKEQAQNAAKELAHYHIRTNRIYTSDLSRTVKTAEIIASYMVGLSHADKFDSYPFEDEDREEISIEIVREPALREMSLGLWDGKFISEVRERYPEEYQKRGEDFLAFKFGNDSENFYDLQYRVMKGLRSILEEEGRLHQGNRDIVIVSHRGVINVILSTLHHAELKEEVKKPVPNGGVIIMDYTWVL